MVGRKSGYVKVSFDCRMYGQMFGVLFLDSISRLPIRTLDVLSNLGDLDFDVW